MNAAKTTKWFLVAVFVALATAAMTPVALAHRVTVFAWVEGDKVTAEAKFPGSGKAKNSPIQVLDDQDRLLLQGKTDADGRFFFAKPVGVCALTVVLDAGMGHRATWKLGAAELGVLPAGTGPDQTAPPAQPLPAPAHPAPAMEQAGPVAPLGPEQIETVVARAVDARLGAVVGRLDLIAARQEKIDMQNLLGAIGYIFGLMGLAAWWKSRSQSKAP